MKTLKELKKKYPDVISTRGNNYIIDGLGWFKQVKGQTYTKDYDGSWIRTDFNELAKFIEDAYKEEENMEDLLREVLDSIENASVELNNAQHLIDHEFINGLSAEQELMLSRLNRELNTLVNSLYK